MITKVQTLINYTYNEYNVKNKHELGNDYIT